MNLRKKASALRSGKRWRRFVQLCFVYTGAFLNLLPRRLVVAGLAVSEGMALPGRHRLCAAYQPYAVSFLADHPRARFSGWPSRWLREPLVRVLIAVGAYREAGELIATLGSTIGSIETTIAHARALFELAEFERSREALSGSAFLPEFERKPDLAVLKGMLDVIEGDEGSAVENMRRASALRPFLMRPHQNIAARSSVDYAPNSLDQFCGVPGRLFDLCNFAGQRVTHVGRGDIGVRLYERALAAQAELRALPPPILSPELGAVLARLNIRFDEMRIIPEEWTSQIGHLGMLDILFRMRELGWWSGTPLMVVRSDVVANQFFFRLFKRFGTILVIGQNISEAVGEELLSLQRWCGLSFNAFRLPNGTVVPWQDAGALAIAQWEREGRGHPLRDEYDRVYGSSPEVAASYRRMREQFGMGPDDWHVCLHIRDASHYFELAGIGQSHRNSPIEAYLDAVGFITSKGGWVIKLGGPNSPKLPPLERTIDYALSDFKSELMDICLIRNAKAFVGTTSGLTNVAVSLGTPSAVVNCISTDAQLWNSGVRFALKPVRLADGKMLTQSQLTSTPWRWRVFDAALLGRSGAHINTNTPEEICAVLQEVEALASGRLAEFEHGYDADTLLSRWLTQLALPHYYGTSKPSLYFLRKYETDFLADRDCQTGQGFDSVDGIRQRVING
jgi:putative glycosyltransferase (TIGR04372 family)